MPKPNWNVNLNEDTAFLQDFSAKTSLMQRKFDIEGLGQKLLNSVQTALSAMQSGGDITEEQRNQMHEFNQIIQDDDQLNDVLDTSNIFAVGRTAYGENGEDLITFAQILNGRFDAGIDAETLTKKLNARQMKKKNINSDDEYIDHSDDIGDEAEISEPQISEEQPEVAESQISEEQPEVAEQQKPEEQPVIAEQQESEKDPAQEQLLNQLRDITEVIGKAQNKQRPEITKFWNKMKELAEPKAGEDGQKLSHEALRDTALKTFKDFKEYYIGLAPVFRTDEIRKADAAIDSFFDQVMPEDEREKQRLEERELAKEKGNVEGADLAMLQIDLILNRENESLYAVDRRKNVTNPQYRVLHDDIVRLKQAEKANTADTADLETLNYIKSRAKESKLDNIFQDRALSIQTRALEPMIQLQFQFKSLKYQIQQAFAGKEMPENWETIYQKVDKLADMGPDTQIQDYTSALTGFTKLTNTISRDTTKISQSSQLLSSINRIDKSAKKQYDRLKNPGIAKHALFLDETSSLAQEYNIAMELDRVISDKPDNDKVYQDLDQSMAEAAEWAEQTLNSKAITKLKSSPLADKLKESLNAIKNAGRDGVPLEIANHMANIAIAADILNPTKLGEISSAAENHHAKLFSCIKMRDMTKSVAANRDIIAKGGDIFIPDPKAYEEEQKRLFEEAEKQKAREQEENRKKAEEREAAKKREEEEKKKAEAKEAKKKEKEKAEVEEAKRRLQRIAKGSTVRRNQLLNCFGPEGTIRSSDDPNTYFTPESANQYNNTKLPVPDDMTEEMVALIALAHATDSRKYDFNQKMTGSGSPIDKFDYASWNRFYLYSTIIPGDSRSRQFSDIMADSRSETKKTLEDYMKTGDPTQLRGVMQNFADLIKEKMSSTATDSALDSNTKQYFKIFREMNEKLPQLQIENMFTKQEWAMVQSLDERIKGGDAYNENAAKIVEELPEPGSERRKELAFELLLNAAVMNAQKGIKHKDFSDYQNEIFTRIGAQLSPPHTAEQLNNHLQKVILSVDNSDLKAKQFYHKLNDQPYTELETQILPLESFTPAQTILTEKDGKETLRQKYSEAIRNSELYQNLVNEKEPKKIIGLIKKAQYTNFPEFKDVKLDDTKARELNSDHTNSQRVIEQWETNVQSAMAFHIGPRKMDKAISGLNHRTFNIFTKESQELKTLREKAAALRDILVSKASQEDKVSHMAMTDPKVRKCALEAYQASVAYQAAKRRNAGYAEDDATFRPRTPDGREHFDCAIEIENYTKQFVKDDSMEKIMNDMAKEAETAERETEKKRLEEARKAEVNKTFDSDSLTDSAVQSAVNDLRAAAEKDEYKNKTAEEKKEAISQNLAKVIAARTVAITHEQRGKDAKIDSEELAEAILKTKNEVQKRDDFKMMMKTNSADELVKAASTKSGSPLMAKLVTAAMRVDEMEQRKQTLKPPKKDSQLNLNRNKAPK